MTGIPPEQRGEDVYVRRIQRFKGYSTQSRTSFIFSSFLYNYCYSSLLHSSQSLPQLLALWKTAFPTLKKRFSDFARSALPVSIRVSFSLEMAEASESSLMDSFAIKVS
ncbi:hypothetical protein TorRG33x02_202390 [Trema orientale]|uniref:Uncharacterized protein n=1 Tax=Trema orientale TaxID=63057 RepID=A0A2P5EEI1_TREOI|nr:hypothetical protein TorRG33x02_202390 [Trema orientale]